MTEMVGRYWDRDTIIDRAQKWAAEHGTPPTVRHWRRQQGVYPSRNSVYDHFPSWPAMLEAAGLQPRKRYGQILWTEQAIVDALLEWTLKHGRPPTSKDWQNAAPDHPGQHTVCYRFGSWNNGLRAAGITAINLPKGGARRIRHPVTQEGRRGHLPRDPVTKVPVGVVRDILRRVYADGWTQGDVENQTRVTARHQYRIMCDTRPAPAWKRHEHRSSELVVTTKYGFVIPALETVTEDTLDRLVTGLGLDLYELQQAA